MFLSASTLFSSHYAEENEIHNVIEGWGYRIFYDDLPSPPLSLTSNASFISSFYWLLPDSGLDICHCSCADCLSVAKRIPYATRCIRNLLSQQHFCIAVTSFSAYNLSYFLAFIAENEELVSSTPLQLFSLSETILHKEMKTRLQLFAAAAQSRSPTILFVHDCLLPAVASLQCCDGVLNLDIPLSERVLRGRQALLQPSEISLSSSTDNNNNNNNNITIMVVTK